MNDVSREVDQLLKERERYESWLKRLELERAGATEQAYRRVRSDYQERLDGVTRKLQSHREAIDAKLGGLEGQIGELERERAERAEQLDEARLRHLVGEYRDDTEWREMEGRLVTALNDSERHLEEVRGEVRRLEEIVTLVEVGEAAAEPPPKPVQVASPLATATAPPEVIEVQAEETPAEVETEPHPEVASPAPPRETPAIARAREPSPPPPSPPASSPPPAATPSPPVTSAAPEPAEAASEAEEEYFSLEALVLEDEDMEDVFISAEPQAEEEGLEPQRPIEVQEAGAGAEQGESAVGDELAFLESLSLGGGEESEFSFLEQRGSGTPQTIICPHCSAANDPAEWYCTECGEELPAE